MIKPDLTSYFRNMPLIGRWIEHDYENAYTINDFIKLFHKWMNIAEDSDNDIKKKYYTASAYYLYSWLTNKSYETKL